MSIFGRGFIVALNLFREVIGLLASSALVRLWVGREAAFRLTCVDTWIAIEGKLDCWTSTWVENLMVLCTEWKQP